MNDYTEKKSLPKVNTRFVSNRTSIYLAPILNIDEGFTKYFLELKKKDSVFGVYLGEGEYNGDYCFYFHLRDKFIDPPKCDNIVGIEKRFLKEGSILRYRIPERFQLSVDNFIVGKYSKMYSNNDLNDLWIHPVVSSGPNWKHMVLTRNPNYIPTFIAELTKANLVDSKFQPDDEWLKTTELDIPPKRADYILEY